MNSKYHIKLNFLSFTLFLIFFGIYLRDRMVSLLMGRMDNIEKSSFTVIALLGTFIFGVYFFIKNIKILKSNNIVKSFILFYLWIVFISYYYSIETPFASNGLYLEIILSLLVISSFFIMTYNNIITKKVLYLLLCIFILLAYNYYKNYYLIYLYFSSENLIHTAVYFLVLFLPVILLNPNRLVKLLCFLFIVFITIISNKRAVIIALFLSSLSYFLTLNYIEKNSLRKIMRNILIFILIFYSCYFLIENLDLDFIFGRFESLKDDGGSGRDEIWEHVFSMIINSNFIQLILGHGWNMVYENSPLKLSAHNDFLEIIYDFGIFGFLLYLNLTIKCFKYVMNLIKNKSSYAAPAMASFVMILIVSSFSHIIIYPHYSYIVLCFWGIILNNNQTIERSLNNRLKIKHLN